MVKRFSYLLPCVISFALLTTVANAAADQFYEGKTVEFVVGMAAGGGFDIYARTIARHIGKHIPGNPSTVVINMPGAGSMIAANHLYNKAKPDGLIVGNFMGPMILQQLLGNKAARFDGRKFGWVGTPVADHGTCVLTKRSGVASLNEWFASKRPLKIGATGAGSTSADIPKVLREALGLPIQVIEGYGGTSEVRLAADTGEVDGACWAWQSIKVMWREGLEQREVRPIIQVLPKAHPDLKDVPTAINYAKTDEARDLLRVVASVYGQTVRPYAVPPGTATERLLLLRKAFMETMKDPELLAEAQKAKLDFEPIDGETTAQIFSSLYELKPATVARIKDILVPKK